MNLILGINAFHPDSSVCALKDGELVAAVAEERLGTRRKHCQGFPRHALECVLKAAGATLRDVDCVAVGHDRNANLAAKIKHVVGTPFQSGAGVLTYLKHRLRAQGLRELVADACGAQLADCRFQVVYVEHHLAHLASSYYASDFDEAAGFSYDGAGDFVSAMSARCQGNRIEVLNRVYMPNSLGYFYTALCQFLGFARFGEEYKVMGLAAYGEPAFQKDLRDLLQVKERGRFQLHRQYFRFLGQSLEDCTDTSGEIVLPRLYTAALAERFGAPRLSQCALTRRDQDLAASCQARFEQVVIHCLEDLRRRVRSERLVTGGGCALNGVCNARILRDTGFRLTCIQPAAADDGTALGAAYYVWNAVLGKPRGAPMPHAFWGPEHSERAMEEALVQADLRFERLPQPELLQRTAALLASGRVVGWYQGRSEWGPRALGNRSILAHPGWPGMKDLINQKVKRREGFRPFAPSILADAVGQYFEQEVESPFMMHVVRIKPGQRQALSAVCHVDSTGRLHTVRRSQNPLYHGLIEAFGARTGTPVLLNTSFNENEPIVDTPEQAVSCFCRNDLDALVLGPFVTEKRRDARQPALLPSNGAFNGRD